MITQKTEKNRSVGFVEQEAETTRQALMELVRTYDHDPHLISVRDLQTIADYLSGMAGRPRGQGWTWRYLRNIINQKINAGHEFTRAIYALGATYDGVPFMVAKAREVMVRAVADVKPGSLVLAASRDCARPGCPVHFVPRVPNQAYCNLECKNKDRARRRKMQNENH